MISPRFSFVPVLGHELHVTEWGNRSNPPLVMWHGLARTGRDFDELAAGLADQYFVVCPDLIGRGLSSWSQNPEAEYNVEYLSAVATGLLDHYNFDKTAWLGTSLGGLIGMQMASGQDSGRLDCLIINDIGPEIPQDAVDRILAYVGELPVFDCVMEAESWLRTVYAPFGPAKDRFWRRMARSSVRRTDEGRITIHYDPRIVLQFSSSAHELVSWERYQRITLPTHVICGAQSDLLTNDILTRMQSEGPKPKITSFSDCGHAPTLSRVEDVKIVRQILDDLRGR